MFWLWLVVGLVIWSGAVLLIGKWIGAGMGAGRERPGGPGAAAREPFLRTRRETGDTRSEDERTAVPTELVKR